MKWCNNFWTKGPQIYRMCPKLGLMILREYLRKLWGLVLWSHDDHFEHLWQFPYHCCTSSLPLLLLHSKVLTHYVDLIEATTLRHIKKGMDIFIALHASSMAHKHAHISISMIIQSSFRKLTKTFTVLHSSILFHNNFARSIGLKVTKWATIAVDGVEIGSLWY